MKPIACSALALAAITVTGCTRLPWDQDPAATTPPADAAAPSEADLAARRFHARAALDDFHRAAAEADADRYLGRLTEDAVFIGTDPTERWTAAEFAEYVRPYQDAGRGWTYVARERFVWLEGDGTVAVFDELLDSDSYGACRGSGVMRWQNGAWRIAQYVLSFSISNDDSSGVTAVVRESAGGEPELGWTEVASGTEASLRGLSVVDGDTVWAGGAGGTLQRTLDGGLTWQSRPIPAPRQTTTGDADAAGTPAAPDHRDVHAFSADVAVVMSITRPAMLHHTEDGGATWTEAWRSDAPDAFLDGVAFWDESHGIAYGDPIDGRWLVLLTDDGGRSWWRVPDAAMPFETDGRAGFAGSGTGVCTIMDVDGRRHAWIGLGGHAADEPDGTPAWILRTADGGATWHRDDAPIASSPSAGVFSIAMRDALRGVAVGGSWQDAEGRAAVAARTVDGGVTWTAYDADAGPGGYRSGAVVVAGSRTLLAAGPTGIDVSRDGGATWEPWRDDAAHVLASGPDGSVWAAGADGMIARIRRTGD